MYKISIVIPIYKVEKYLDQCIETVVGQSYKNLEIILVDDGSPDNCPEICDEWSKKDKRIKVVHKENGGLSDARNAGISVATGEYIGFVDSDDCLAPDMYSRLLDQIIKDKSDVAICSTVLVEEGTYVKKPFRPIVEEGICNGKEAFLKICKGEGLIAVMNRLYKRTLFDSGLSFLNGILYEDVYFDVDLFLKNELTVSFINYEGYYYLQRSTSIMGQSIKNGLSKDAVTVRRYMFEEIKKQSDDYKNAMLPYCVFFLMGELDNKQSLKKKDFLEDCYVFFKEIAYDILKCYTLGITFKIKYCMVIIKMKYTLRN